MARMGEAVGQGNKRMEHGTAREEGKPKKETSLVLSALHPIRSPQLRPVVYMITVALNVTNAGNTGNMKQRGCRKERGGHQ